ncbi:hypothetical protein F5X71_18020 [Nocardia brasiliensis]|uniref:Uncharacterized protein n=1 Tax=Nocardia brasiliensis TaxID=37326 RepID=A0A6G9XSS9_NOCBR|nr:WXG100 family type VII secretion target [Nocardia brasiliensis]QIS03965.1 hypothetical protein F5X71_18020 [Nocardia brasiliensis]
MGGTKVRLTPSRRQLDEYDPQPLLTIAREFRECGAKIEGLFDRYVTSVTDVDWRGKAAEAAHDRAVGDRKKAFSLVDALEDAARRLEQGYWDIHAPLNSARGLISGAESAGFVVPSGGGMFVAVPISVYHPAGIVPAPDRELTRADWERRIVAAADAVSAADSRIQQELAGIRITLNVEFAAVAPIQRTDEQKRANQIAAFRAVYHRDPVSENDWRMAEALDRHTYDPKYQGVDANIVAVRFDPVTGAGLYRQNMYIPTDEVNNIALNINDWLEGRLVYPMRGDNRGPSADAAAEASRVSLYVDMENGLLIARQNPTVSVDGRQAGAGVPDVRVAQGADGSLKVQYSAVDPYAPEIAKPVAHVDGDMTITRKGGEVVAGGQITQYPSTEAYQYRSDGSTTTLIDRRASTDPWAAATDLPGPRTQVGTMESTPMSSYPAQPTDSSPKHPAPYTPTDAGPVENPPKAIVVEPYSPPPPPPPREPVPAPPGRTPQPPPR